MRHAGTLFAILGALVMATFPVGPNTGPDQAAYLAQLQDAYSQPGIEYYGSAFGQAGMATPYGGYGGGGGGNVVNAYQQAYDEAKAANEQRYQDILTGYQDRSIITAPSRWLTSNGHNPPSTFILFSPSIQADKNVPTKKALASGDKASAFSSWVCTNK